MSVDARQAYDLWLRLIADEPLYEATRDGSHRDLAASRALTASGLLDSDLAILDEFHRLPGTRWNIENLRFRAAAEAAASLVSFLPRTIRMLTGGNVDWLQELAFEYLAFYEWNELGHHRLSECERFASYVRKRVLKRRIPPAHIEPVLHYELAVIGLYRQTQAVRPDAWPTGQASDNDDELARVRLCAAPASKLVDLPVNLLESIRSGEPPVAEPPPEPISLLLVVPSLRETHRVWRLTEGARALFASFAEPITVAEVARRTAADLGFSREGVFKHVRRWIADRALAG